MIRRSRFTSSACNRAAIVIGLFLGAFVLPGCMAGVTNLTPSFLKIQPIIDCYQDPDMPAGNYRTFSVFSYSVISDSAKLYGIEDKQMLFQLRNIFEERGYRFVALNESPDFLVTIDAQAGYRESYIPPSQVTVPYWHPGQTITTYGSSQGNFSYNTFGAYSSYGWGTYNGTSTATTTTPGYFTTRTYSTSGYVSGDYYPMVSVDVFDGKTLANVWKGVAVGCSGQRDVRVSAQQLLWGLGGKFPRCASDIDAASIKTAAGLSIAIYTLDGNNYFPLVGAVGRNSVAALVGIRPYDIVVEVNGVLLLNKTCSQVIELFREQKAGSEVNLVLWRVKKAYAVSFIEPKRQESLR